MKKILSRYIAFEFIRMYLLVFSAFSSIVIIGSLFGQISHAVINELSFLEFAKKFAILLPTQFEITIPLSVLFATVSTFSTLGRNSEIIAMHFAGMGLWKLATPIFYVCVFIAILGYLNQNHWHTWMVTNWGITTKEQKLPPVWVVGNNEQMYYFGERNANATARDIHSFQWKKNPFAIQKVTKIEEIERKSVSWVLQKITTREFTEQEQVLWNRETSRIVPAIEIPTIDFEIPLHPHHQHAWDLYETIQKMTKEGQDTTEHWSEFHYKFASMLSIFLMSIIGLTLSISHTRDSKVAEAFVFSCFLGMFFLISNQIFLIIGKTGIISPMIAIWTTNFLFMGITFFLWQRAKV